MGNQKEEAQTPVLSTVVAMVSDTADGKYDLTLLERCLQAFSHQVDPPPMEILVPYPIGLQGVEHLIARYPLVKFIEVDDLRSYTGQGGSHEHHNELRARGLLVARGEILALAEDHSYPDAHWCRLMVEAYPNCFAAVGGAIENSVDRPLNWAVYFCDFGRYQNPLHAGESRIASDVNVSYKRSALEAIRPVWQASFCETEVNWALQKAGEKLALSPKIIVFENRENLRFANAIKERYIWGRSYAVSRNRVVSVPQRTIYALLSPLLPFIITTRMIFTVLRKGRLVRKFFLVVPIIIPLVISWSLGEFFGYVTGKPAGG